MRTTSIIHCKNANYQIDFQGSPSCCVGNFMAQCKSYEALWGILLNEETAEMMVKYTGEKITKGII